MAGALTPPFLLGAALLVLAGAAKLRRPQPAVSAAIVLGLPPANPAALSLLVRAFATGEVVLGLACLIAPSTFTEAVLSALYSAFAAVTLLLAGRRASCGCFGAVAAPASPLQSLLSGGLALVALSAALEGVHGITWLLGPSPLRTAVTVLGLTAALYATAVAYRDLPRLWSAWSPS